MMRILILGLLLCACAARREGWNGCIRISGICVKDCPPGTHEFSSNCSAPTWSERTCASPQPHDLGAVCDMSRCDCDAPKVKDQKTGECVLLHHCSQKR